MIIHNRPVNLHPLFEYFRVFAHSNSRLSGRPDFFKGLELKKIGPKYGVQKAGCILDRFFSGSQNDPCFQNKNSGCRLTGRIG